MNQDLTNYQQRYSMLPSDTTDEMLINMWLDNAAPSTKEAYRADLKQFFEQVPLPIQQIKLNHFQGYKNYLIESGKEPATINRKLKSVKSLLSFAEKTGYTPLNVGVMVKVKKEKEELAERILTEDQVRRMFYKAEEQDSRRNYTLIYTLYQTAARVSEICGLKWKDVQPRGDTCQVALYGKGGKTRHIILRPEACKALMEYRGNSLDEDYVFKSRGGGQPGHTGSKIDESQVSRIVEEAAVRAQIALYQDSKGRTRSHVSPHWLRHSHATHALENGANIILVKETLGHKSIDTTTRYTHVHPDKSSAQHLRV